MTAVARGLKGDSLILDVGQFEKKCGEMKIKRFPYNFMAAIYSTDNDMKNVVSDFTNVSENISDLGFPSSEQTNFLKQTMPDSAKKAFFCSYRKVGGQEFTQAKKSYLLRFYPVAVQYPRAVSTGDTYYLIVPGLMAMVFWE